MNVFDFSMVNIDLVGAEYLDDKIDTITDHVDHLTPVEFNEQFRYLSRGETQFSGLMNFDLTPYWIKPLNQLDPYDPAREIIVKKGVKTSYNTTMIEGGILYLAAHLRAFKAGFITANKEMAQKRMESHVITMFQNSGFGDIFRASDSDSTNKTGKTKQMLQWLGGGDLTPEGAKNADTMRMFFWQYIFMDEVSTWPEYVGQDGDPTFLVRSRAEAIWDQRKISIGGTPTIKGRCHIEKHFKRGNQQHYECRCLKCGYPMRLRWFHDDLTNKSVKRGLIWEYVGDLYDPTSVRYECWNCGHGHQEHDKPKFINKDNCEWKETATPVEPNIESYNIPALLSRFKKWSDHVATWHEAFTRDEKVKSQEKLQGLYNNVFGDVFEIIESKLTASAAYSHRRDFYHKGQILNDEIEKYCKSGIAFVCMTVDVQLHYLSVAVWGVTIGGNMWLLWYDDITDASESGTLEIDSPAWEHVRQMIDGDGEEEQLWMSDDNKEYPIAITLVDCSWGESDAVVHEFCSNWSDQVYAIKGDPQSRKRISSFYEYKTSAKTYAYMIAVDHYKDRLAPVLRRRWVPEDGDQQRFHFNAYVDISQRQLKELTTEYKRPKKDKFGNIVSEWHRPHGVRNELWDLLVYANAAVDIIAHRVCTLTLELQETDFQEFWSYIMDEELFFVQH